ncbi:ATP-binding protein [Streptomyces endophyticus]|uniref:ATP-binding protein n=1 Tax=Streptomyces endophyticus TaxID=714166 RepID=A0ABU6F317_9ACTN|nr:ATP-binding protein [Streptomyces endophyticus]MEB8338391.1 ATP-binding protein [Streptomyces endophyticus]
MYVYRANGPSEQSTSVSGQELPEYAERSRPLLTWNQSVELAAAHARERVRQALDAYAVAPHAVDAAVLVASELVANACEHARGPYQLRLTVSRTLGVEVLDRGPGLPAAVLRRAPVAPGSAERGRGLLLVDRLAGGTWGSRSVAGGHCVWAEISTG